MKLIDRTARKYFGDKFCYIVVIPPEVKLSQVMEWYNKEEYPYAYHSNPDISKKYKMEARNGDKEQGYYMAFSSEKLQAKIIKDLKTIDFKDVENDKGINTFFKGINFDMANNL